MALNKFTCGRQSPVCYPCSSSPSDATNQLSAAPVKNWVLENWREMMSAVAEELTFQPVTGQTMATVLLGYRRIAYGSLSVSWTNDCWSLLYRTNIQVTRSHQAETLTFSWQCTSARWCWMQCTSHWLPSKLSVTEFVQLNYPACSPDLAPSDYFLIRNLKSHLCGTWFIDAESLKITVEAWFKSRNRKFYFQG